MSALVQTSHTAAMSAYPERKQGVKSTGIDKPVILGFCNFSCRWRGVKMRAESGPIHLPWREAEIRPSAFRSSCTVKSSGAAYSKCVTLSAEMRSCMSARNLETDALSHLPRHCIIS